MTEALFSIQTLRALHRGSGSSVHVSFIQGEDILAGPLVGIGSRLSVQVSGRLVEDIHPNQVIRAEAR
ncbi:hypothetical protein [Streptomyces sp. H27-H5]|uniref:hypothetical protein n=1 Tax=Streptomyces sp. H27-H5 TaxID=2996460 RepID=UPI00226DF9DE|nr:hypothetical protein [Streptomyces sp. H27-H5]MCY0955827.1 hypothetical protein [Streptomyces sp. H27-H5]